ncbi:MAG: capsule biosynthesis protein [Flavimaricola sp.]|nr:capsule biosynthesis protein [Flavimaricola sp.]
MTTKPKARKFRIRRNESLTTGMSSQAASVDETEMPEVQEMPMAVNQSGRRQRAVGDVFTAPQDPAPVLLESPIDVSSPQTVAAEQDIDSLRREGLTGRQLRMARRIAQKHGLAVTSDFDAVRQLRARGIDPFKRSNVLELVVPPDEAPAADAEGANKVQLPQTMKMGKSNLPSTERMAPADRRANEIMQIQRDMAKRRRKKSMMLLSRLAFFVMLPTILVGYYFNYVATPMYATKSEFVIQQAESAAAAGLGGLFAGTSMATQQDSITVQSYLTSRAALARLDEEHQFKAAFSDPQIDPIQRLPADATNEAAYGLYQDHIRISYDPTEGILKMEVIAPDPALSQQFSEALIGYAEEQVDQLTQRLREDQMSGARTSYEAAERRRAEALAAWLQIQQDVQQIDPVGETAARTQQISTLESQRQQLQLELQTRLNVSRPVEAQVNALRAQITGIETLIADLRNEMTMANATGDSLAAKNTELRLAEENYTFQTVLVQQALQQMEAAQIEANRQVRYLSLGVVPTAPDEATYPRAFENTVVAFLIFAGLYLMLSITASILREQVNS